MLRRLGRASMVLVLVGGLVGVAPGLSQAGESARVAAVPAPVFVRSWGAPGTGAGTFDTPRGLAVHPATGYVYVADTANHLVQAFTATGSYLSQGGGLGSSQSQLNGVSGVAFGPGNNLYAADTGNNRVKKTDDLGGYLTEWDGFSAPRGVAVGPDGSVYVTNDDASEVKKFTDDGTPLATSSTALQYPSGVAADATHVYVADTSNHRVVVLDTDLDLVTSWGSQGTGNGQFNAPRDVAVDDNGDVYVTDTGNHRVQKFTADGTFLVAWGSQGTGTGRFQSPWGVETAPGGQVYVSDTGNNRIQQFGPADPTTPDVAVAFGGDLWGMQADGTDLVRLTSTSRSDFEPDWSPDGTRIAYSSREWESSDLYLVDADGANVTVLTSGNPDDVQPSWSPDGSRLAFSRSTGTSTRIYTVDPDGSNLVALTNPTSPKIDLHPTWSPDGTKIAFIRGVFSPTSQRASIYVMDADGANPTPVTSTTGAIVPEAPDWSPDGATIAFSAPGPTAGTSSIYAMDPDGSDRHPIYTNTTWVTHPSWSPDSSQLVFDDEQGVGDGDTGIAVMNADGSSAAFIYYRYGGTPDWNPTVGVEPIQSCGINVVTVDTAAGESPTRWDDVIRGTAAPDVIDGLGGWDLMCGLGGGDTLTGGPGADVLKGAGGDDTLRGLGGNDRMAGGTGTDTCRGGTGTDSASTCETVTGVP